jgi:23S rRNA pseudouridine1911/1915/1917 synthase
VSAAGSAENPDELGLSDEFTGLAEPESELRQVVVGVAQHGTRLDRALVELVPEFSRSYLQQLLSQGLVSLNGRPATKAAARVKAGDPVAIEMRPTLQSQAFRPESLPINVVYEDEHLLVINKPAGLVVHPAPGNWGGTLLNGLLARDEKAQWVPRAGIVHRLDKDTSGLMVVAKDRATMDALVCMIAERAVHRQYLAVAHRPWTGPHSRTVQAPIGRDPRNRLRMAVVNLDSHPAKLRARMCDGLQAMTSVAGWSAPCTLDAPIRFGCTWHPSGTRWLRTVFMEGLVLREWSARRFMPIGCVLRIRSPGGRSSFAHHCRTIWRRRCLSGAWATIRPDGLPGRVRPKVVSRQVVRRSRVSSWCALD